MTQLPRHFRQMHSNRALPRFVHAVVPRATRDGIELVVGEFDALGFGELDQIVRVLARPRLFHLLRGQIAEACHTLPPSGSVVLADRFITACLLF